MTANRTVTVLVFRTSQRTVLRNDIQDSLGCLCLRYLVCEVKLRCIWRELYLPSLGLLYLPSSKKGMITRTCFLWVWNRIAANACMCLKGHTDALWLGLFKGLAFHQKGLFCSMGRGCNKANKWQSQTCVPLVLARVWRESETQDPGHRPAPCWALPGHGLNTERSFGTLTGSYKDYLFKQGNKTGRHAKLRSMEQLSPVWKGYCWKLKSVFLCWAALWNRSWTTGKDKNRWY